MSEFSTEVRVRLPETDSMGIVFHGWFFTYMDVARMDYLRNLGLIEGINPTKDFYSVVVRTDCDFKSPARFDDPLIVTCAMTEIRNSSFRFEFKIFHKRENRLVAQGNSVHCALDRETWKPIPVPEEFRKIIRKFEGNRLVEP